MVKEGSMLLSVLRFPSLHLLHLCVIYCVYLQKCGNIHVNFWWCRLILGVVFKIQMI